MTFHEVFYFLSDGNPIRRKSWDDIRHISFDRENNCFNDVFDDTGGWWCVNPPVTMNDLSADDWEVCEWDDHIGDTTRKADKWLIVCENDNDTNI